MEPRKSSALKKLSLWQALIFPVALALYGAFTWFKDHWILRHFSRRRVEAFRFIPSGGGGERAAEPMRILVVDESQLHQEVSLRMLEKSGYLPDFANNAPEAIEACRRNHYDLVLMDVYMPGPSAIQTAATLRRESASKTLRIIAVTGHMLIDADGLKSSGVDAILSKPLIRSELQRELRLSTALLNS